MALTEEIFDLPEGYYSAFVSDPAAVNALQQRAAVTTLLNQHPTLGGGFVMTPAEQRGYHFTNARYDIYLGFNVNDDEEFPGFNWNWEVLIPGDERPPFLLQFLILDTPLGHNVTIPQFQVAINAVKSIIQNPVLPAPGAGGKRRRKTRKHRTRTTRRR